jgi:hypothetical protein
MVGANSVVGALTALSSLEIGLKSPHKPAFAENLSPITKGCFFGDLADQPEKSPEVVTLSVPLLNISRSAPLT